MLIAMPFAQEQADGKTRYTGEDMDNESAGKV